MATRRDQQGLPFYRDRRRLQVEALETRYAPAGLADLITSGLPPDAPAAEAAPWMEPTTDATPPQSTGFVGPIFYGTPHVPTSAPEEGMLPVVTTPGEVITKEHFDQVFKVIGEEAIDQGATDGAIKQYDYRREAVFANQSFDWTMPPPAQSGPLPAPTQQPELHFDFDEAPYGPKGVGGSEEAQPLATVAMRPAETPEPPALPTRSIEARPTGAGQPTVPDENATTPDQAPPSPDAQPRFPDDAMLWEDHWNEAPSIAIVEPALTAAENPAPATVPLGAAFSAGFFALPGLGAKMSKRVRRGMDRKPKWLDIPPHRDRSRAPPRLSWNPSRR